MILMRAYELAKILNLEGKSVVVVLLSTTINELHLSIYLTGVYGKFAHSNFTDNYITVMILTYAVH